MDNRLVNNYKTVRQYGATARFALHCARTYTAQRNYKYPKSSTTIHRVAGNLYISGDESGLGFRLYEARSIRRLDHSGWYADAFQDNLFVPVVLTLRVPSKELAVFIGYEDKNYDTYIVQARPYEYITRDQDYDTGEFGSLRDAALAADDMARYDAEKSRESDEAYQAGSQYADNIQEIKELRAKVRGIVHGLRDCTIGNAAVCDALKSQICTLRAQVSSLIEECRGLRDGNGYGREHRFSFYAGSKLLEEAFNQGAGI